MPEHHVRQREEEAGDAGENAALEAEVQTGVDDRDDVDDDGDVVEAQLRADKAGGLYEVVEGGYGRDQTLGDPEVPVPDAPAEQPQSLDGLPAPPPHRPVNPRETPPE